MKTIFTTLIVIIMWLGFIKPIEAQIAEVQFEKGLIKEEGEGNLKEAIEIYTNLASDDSANRTLRAKALMRVGICHEKLGNKNARDTYQKVISEYADQRAIVAMVKIKLSGLKKPSRSVKKEGIIASQVWSKAQDSYAVSPDGRYLSYIDWDNISTNIKDLFTGKTKALTSTGTWKGDFKYPDKSIFSPDSKKVAYTWYEGDDSELHIVNVDGSSNMILAQGKGFTAPFAVAWSPDNKYILAIMATYNQEEIAESRNLVLVSVNDGSIKVLKSSNLSLGDQMDISPDGKYIVYAQQERENFHEKDIYIISTDGSMDKKLVGDLANDTNPLWSPDGKEILFVSDRYGNKDLWKIKVENGKPIGAAELVKVNVGSSVWLLGITKDKSVYYATNNTRTDVYTVNLNDKSGKGKPQGNKISKLSEKNNINPFWSSDGRYVGYLNWPDNRVELGRQYLLTIYDTQTGKSRNIDTEIYGYPRMSKAQWLPDGKTILLFGIAKNSLKYDFYLLDISTGKYTAINTSSNSQEMLRSYNNPIISHDGKSIFYLSYMKKKISKIDIASKKETIVYTDKDAIAHFRLSHDDSKIAFRYYFENTKELYVVSALGGEKRRIMRSTNDSSIYLNSWSEDDKHLYYYEGENFQNLEKLMRVSVAGGDAEEKLVLKDIFGNGKVHNASILPDGQQITIALRVGIGNEVWKIDGIFDD